MMTMLDEKIEQIIVGRFTITEASVADKVSIYLSKGPAAGEGGEFSLELFEKAIDAFYNENF